MVASNKCAMQVRFYVGAGGTCPSFTSYPQIQKLAGKCRSLCISYFFGFGDEGADGAMPQRIIGLEPVLELCD